MGLYVRGMRIDRGPAARILRPRQSRSVFLTGTSPAAYHRVCAMVVQYYHAKLNAGAPGHTLTGHPATRFLRNYTYLIAIPNSISFNPLFFFL